MDHYKDSITNLSILSFILATIVLINSWKSLNCNKSFFSLEKNASNSISEQKDELEMALEKASMPNKTVIIAIVNKAYVEPQKNDCTSMLDLFLEGFWVGEETRQLVDHLLLVSMDKTAHERCEFRRLNCYSLTAEDGDSGDRFADEKIYLSDEFLEMMWRRTRFLLDVLRRGYNFLFTDTDVLWLRNPFTRLSKNETLDLQLSTDFYDGNPFSAKNQFNTGFYFIRSNNKTTSLFQKWYETRKMSKGIKEQDALMYLIKHVNILGELNLNVRFLNPLYFNGFCTVSRYVGVVVTVHANCCQSIKAKVVDLNAVLRSWKMFKNDPTHIPNNFRWYKPVSCLNSWGIRV